MAVGSEPPLRRSTSGHPSGSDECQYHAYDHAASAHYDGDRGRNEYQNDECSNEYSRSRRRGMIPKAPVPNFKTVVIGVLGTILITGWALRMVNWTENLVKQLEGRDNELSGDFGSMRNSIHMLANSIGSLRQEMVELRRAQDRQIPLYNEANLQLKSFSDRIVELRDSLETDDADESIFDFHNEYQSRYAKQSRGADTTRTRGGFDSGYRYERRSDSGVSGLFRSLYDDFGSPSRSYDDLGYRPRQYSSPSYASSYGYDEYDSYRSSSYRSRGSYDSDSWMNSYKPSKRYEERREEFEQLVSDLETRIDQWRLYTRAVDFQLQRHQLISRFPRILHQTWKDKEEFPVHFASSVRTCLALHPTWEYRFWSDNQNQELIERLYPKYSETFHKMAAIKQADIARLVILYEFGGVYLDFDVECARPLDELLLLSDELDIGCILGAENELHTVLLEDRTNPMVSNAMMIARPKHPFIGQLIDHIFQKAAWCGHDPVECTGPRILDSLSINYGHNSTDESAAKVVRLPYQYFSPRIAGWNSMNMAKPCERLQALHEEEKEGGEALYDSWTYKVPRDRVETVCEAGKAVQQHPRALETNRTYSRHLWQCSWCRDDPRLSRRMPLSTLWQNITSRPWTGAISSAPSTNFHDQPCDTTEQCRKLAELDSEKGAAYS